MFYALELLPSALPRCLRASRNVGFYVDKHELPIEFLSWSDLELDLTSLSDTHNNVRRRREDIKNKVTKSLTEL